jgi:hypothetical protein
MDRFKMNFGNLNNQQLIRQILQGQKSIQPSLSNGRLNSSMIDRVYKVSPGCSACSKKVM